MGSGRVEERQRSARKRKITADTMWERGRLGWKEKTTSTKRVRSVAVDPDNIENSKEVGREAQGTQGLSKNCTSRESVSPLSRFIIRFRNK